MKKFLATILCLSLFVGGLVFWPQSNPLQATIATEVTRDTYSGNGTVFPYTFKIFAKTDLLVIVRDADGNETEQVVDSDYTVSGVGVDAGGNVTFTVAPASTETILILRNRPLKQETSYSNTGPFLAKSHEDALDELTMLVQQLQEQLDRSIHVKKSSTLTDLEFSEFDAGEYVRVNLAGTGLDSTDAVYDLGNFLQSGTGAVSRTAASKMGEIVSVKDFAGVEGDGVNDDGAGIQAAIDAVELSGAKLDFPAATYITGVQIDIRDPISIWGPGATLKQKDGSNITSVLNITVSFSEDVYIRIKVDGNMANNTAVNGALISGPSTGHSDIHIAAANCDNGIVVEGNTESTIFHFDVTGCTIGVLERYVAGSTPDENTYFISGHANGTHYKKSCASGGKITSIVHLSCEVASAEAVNITTVDGVSLTVLNGEVRGCASHGVIVDDPTGAVRFGNLVIDGIDTASTWGLRIDSVGRVSGAVGISNFAGGLWVKECSGGGSLQVHTSALEGPEAGVQLGDNGGGTAAQRFVLTPGSYIMAGDSTNAVHFDNAFHCVAHLALVAGLTYDVLMDNSSANNVVYANGRNITLSKYLDSAYSLRDNRFVFDGEYIATFTDGDATPSVLGYSTFLTNTTGVTITRFDQGYAGQVITIISKGAIVYDTTANARLIGSSVDITTAAGDITTWVCEISGTTSSVWRLTGFVDISVDNSAGA